MPSIVFKIRKNKDANHESIEQNETNPERDIARSHVDSQTQQRREVQSAPQKTQNNSEMKQLMSMFETFMKQSMQNSQKTQEIKIIHNPATIEYQPRDRLPVIELPQINKSTQTLTGSPEISNAEIQKWITILCNTTFSAAFNYYSTDKFSYQQARTYCAEAILTNLLRLTERFKINEDQLNLIDRHMKKKVLPYLQKKYPLTLSNTRNKLLQKSVQQSNHLDLLSNDFLSLFGFMFEYRESGNYNDMIMRLINKTMQLIDSPSTYWGDLPQSDAENGSASNYKDFQLYMTRLFEKVYDEDWVEGKPNKFYQKLSQEGDESNLQFLALKKQRDIKKKQYRQKVKDYTHYLIGRKISENTENYSQKQIRSQNLKIKSVAVLRILTKWCEELWQKFDKENYFTQRTESIQLQKPEFVNPFFKWMKTEVDALMAAEKVNVVAFMKDLQKNAFHQQSSLLLKNLAEDDVNFIPRMEKAYGKFSIQMVKHLHSYIILYLNRLIHGLLIVSNKFYKKIDKSWDEWQAPPNLLTFKIGDLIRCKCSSKQRQIVKIFNEIKRISNTRPQKMKIVRVKNRLKQGTNDILINIKFNNLIICEIQLGVNTNHSKFITCSNNFCHYLYQLERSIFGPLFELCSIWNSLDPRATEFQKINNQDYEKQYKQYTNSTKTEQTDQCEHNYNQWNLPFQCSTCKNLYYNNDYFVTNKICSKCLKCKCSRCQIKEMDPEQLKRLIFKGRKNKQFLQICTLQRSIIPQYGVCVYIESNTIQLQVFHYSKVESKYYLFGMKNDKIYQIKKVSNDREIKQFLRSYCIFSVNKTDGKRLIDINEHKAHIFRIQQYIRQTFKQQKQVLIFTQLNLSTAQMQELLHPDTNNFERARKKIHRIEYASNNQSSIEYLYIFEKLISINLNYNTFVNTSVLSRYNLLEKLQMRGNSLLSEIQDKFCELERLEEAKFSNCSISKISQHIGKLRSLQYFSVDKNSLTSIPASIGQLGNLKVFNISANSITDLPDSIGKLGDLKYFNVSRNLLTKLPNYFYNLQNLIVFDCSQNNIQVIEDNLQTLLRLQQIKMNKNKLKVFPQSLSSLDSLRVVEIANNQINGLPENISKWTKLTDFKFNQNNIKSIPDSIGFCTNIRVLQMYSNELEALPREIGKLTNLKPIVDLSKNMLKQFPQALCDLDHLTEINLKNNIIETITPDISKILDLKILKLSMNKIKLIPESIQNLTELSVFEVEDNHLELVPDCLERMTSLKIKDKFKAFNRNKIKRLTSYFFNKDADMKISFTYNSLQLLPLDLILNKLSIISLVFSNNQIKQISRSIKEFSNLIELNVSHNLIEVIPKQLEQLLKMSSNGLAIEKNPIKIIECDEFVKEKGTKLTKKFLKELKQKESKALQKSNMSNPNSESKDQTIKSMENL